MKKVVTCFIIIVLITLIQSCGHRSTEDALTGGNYKYWIFKNKSWRGKSKQIEYFDKNGKNLHFVIYANGDFEKYNGGDILLHEYWNLPKYNSFNWGGKYFEILKLTDSMLIIKNRTIDTFVVAPETLIPEGFRKRQ